MAGTYFVPRIVLAFIVPLTLASLGPATSHPQLGTDMAIPQAAAPSTSLVYRAQDVKAHLASNELQKQGETIKLQAFRRGRKIHLKQSN